MPTRDELDETYIALPVTGETGDYRYITRSMYERTQAALRSDDWKVHSAARTRVTEINAQRDMGRDFYPEPEQAESTETDSADTEPTRAPTDTKGLTIHQFTASNVLRLVFADFHPDNGMVVISGKNGAGKSSVLNAIWLALTGKTASSHIGQPIRDGEEQAKVTLDLGEYTVTRTWKDGQPSRLTVETATGNRVSSPQTILDRLTGAMIDPQAFIDAKPSEQLERLLDVIDLGGIDIPTLDAERQQAYDARREQRRKAKELAAQIDGLPPVLPDTPRTEISTAEIAARFAEARSAIEEHRRREQENNEKEAALAKARDRKQALESEIARLTEEITVLEAETSSEWERLAAEQLPDLDKIDEELATVDQRNQRIRDAIARDKLHDQLALYRENVNEFDAEIARIDRTKEETLAAANMPVPGLGFDENGVTLNGVPFDQGSTAEQLRAAVAIAMAGNPDLKVVFIRNGSLLDDDSMSIIEELTTAHGYQTFVERVSDDDPAAIIIDAGEVVDRADNT